MRGAFPPRACRATPSPAPFASASCGRPISSDCGAELVAYRIGWALAILCGDHRVLVSAGDLDEAETAADERLATLELFNPSGLPACRRLLTVSPVGGITIDRAPKGDRLPPHG